MKQEQIMPDPGSLKYKVHAHSKWVGNQYFRWKHAVIFRIISFCNARDISQFKLRHLVQKLGKTQNKLFY